MRTNQLRCTITQTNYGGYRFTAEHKNGSSMTGWANSEGEALHELEKYAQFCGKKIMGPLMSWNTPAVITVKS